MPPQTEAQLERTLIAQMNKLGFESVSIMDKIDLEMNLKRQLEKFNQTTFTDEEFVKILNHLNKGDRFNKAKTLRDRFVLKREGVVSGDKDENAGGGEAAAGEIDKEQKSGDMYVRFFNTDEWCKNEYQVTNQITQKGRYENRYDVTLLVNGVPMVQIELKRRGVEMKEAFNQIQRYHKHSFTGTLFEYVQVFVISNGVNTKYFANNPKQSFEQTFYWTDEANKKITNLEDFANAFLEKCRLSEYIAEYIVLAESTQTPMALRPYQYYAVKAIENRVSNSDKNGYIWHTTGSGKTLTSFKASQILSRNPEVKKVLFVVDRKDLDIQTTKEFNSFSDGSVDGTDHTMSLVEQLNDKKRKLIVTTIQKLDIAISRESYLKQFEYLKDEKVIVIFDECHRSQFGKTHANIKGFFNHAQIFGFTGTPIFAENNVGGVTTKDVFEECLHKYIITNAISDNNVLGFSVEYIGKYVKKESDVIDADIFADALVKDINTKEVLESADRLNKISDHVLADWKRKTKDGKFNAFFAVSSVEMLKKYYKLIKSKKKDDFKIATIFTYKANEEESNDMLDVDVFGEDNTNINQHSRDFLEECISEYNTEFATNFSTDRFYDYYKDLQKRIKNKEIDLVLVVNMFLTGFDSPRLNTLYVDKNLRYHGLVQAYSRTNRLLNSDKPHGNIICFRNLKEETDKALSLFGDENAKEIVFKKPYEEHKKEFENKLEELKRKVPTVNSVDDLMGEEEKSEFVKSFRDLLRIKSSLETFAEFNMAELGISEQEFYDYQSKYLDIYEDRKKNEINKESVLDEIDFEIELTRTDNINYDYIIRLIIGLQNLKNTKDREKKTEEILNVLDRDIKLRKKKDLIKKFIEDNLPSLDKSENVEDAFTKYWDNQKLEKIKEIATTENIDQEKIESMIGEYLYTQKLPREQKIVDMLPVAPKLLERKSIVDRVKNAILNVVDVFEW